MSQLEKRVSKMESDGSGEGQVHFFTIKSPKEEEMVNAKCKDFPTNAVIFKVIYEQKPAGALHDTE